MKRALILAAAAVLIVSLGFSSSAPSRAQKPEDKYAPLCGEYSFDLSAYGIGVITAKVYAENGYLYVWASSSDSPDMLNAVEDKPANFFIDDPDEGHWDFEFLKDEAGKYTKLRIVNEGLAIDSVGQRIGG
jgi:hypothetical protein